MEIERERIEMLIKHHELIRDRYSGSDFACTQQEAIEALRLALAHIDSARARRVGEAVIASMSAEGLTHDDLTNFDSFDDRDGYPVEVPHFDLSDLLRAIAAALRGEP